MAKELNSDGIRPPALELYVSTGGGSVDGETYGQRLARAVSFLPVPYAGEGIRLLEDAKETFCQSTLHALAHYDLFTRNFRVDCFGMATNWLLLNRSVYDTLEDRSALGLEISRRMARDRPNLGAAILAIADLIAPELPAAYSDPCK